MASISGQQECFGFIGNVNMYLHPRVRLSFNHIHTSVNLRCCCCCCCSCCCCCCCSCELTESQHDDEGNNSFGQFFLELTSTCPSEILPWGRPGTTDANIIFTVQYLYASYTPLKATSFLVKWHDLILSMLSEMFNYLFGVVGPRMYVSTYVCMYICMRACMDVCTCMTVRTYVAHVCKSYMHYHYYLSILSPGASASRFLSCSELLFWLAATPGFHFFLKFSMQWQEIWRI